MTKTNNNNKKWKFLKLNGTINRKYKVSNHGEIVLTKNMIPLKQLDMQKKSPKNGTDYKSVSIRGIRQPVRVHRAVCETFHGKPPAGKYFVNHIDEHKDNNFPTNLEWVSPSENAIAYYKNNTRRTFSPTKISQVKKLLNKGWTNDRVAQKIGMSDSNVSSIKLGYIHSTIKPFTNEQVSLGN